MLELFPIAHQYAFQTVLDSMCAAVKSVPTQLTFQKSGPTSMMVWLQLAEALQLDDLRTILLSLIANDWATYKFKAFLQDVDGLKKLQQGTLVDFITKSVSTHLKS